MRLTSPLRIDGRLDEQIYTTVPPVTGMIQTEPRAGEPSTQQTDAWVMFDRDTVYVGVRCWDAHPERMIMNEMRRDNTSLYKNDHVDIVFDTFYDRRNGVLFSTTPIGGRVDAQITNDEFLPAPFQIAPAVTVPVGGYGFASVQSGYNFGQQRRVSGNVSLEAGSFYDGHRTTVAVRSGRMNIGPRFSIEPTDSVNWIDLREGAFITRVIGSRVTYTMTPRMFASALVQANSGANAVAANVRLRWEYRPGSELFVVYNEQRDSLAPRFPDLANRAVIVKINRLFRY